MQGSHFCMTFQTTAFSWYRTQARWRMDSRRKGRQKVRKSSSVAPPARSDNNSRPVTRPQTGDNARMRRALFKDSPRLLTSDAFAFELDGELRRAARSHNALTLVVIEAREPKTSPAALRAVDVTREVARV